MAPISEYTDKSKVDRSKSLFKTGEIKLLLYSERYHFFRRTKTRDIKHAVFYSLPSVSNFYPEILNNISGDGNCTVLYSNYDKHVLERIVGSNRAKKMINGSKSAYMFSN